MNGATAVCARKGAGAAGRRYRRQFEPVAEGRHHILQRALEVDRRLCLVAELQPSNRVLPRDTQPRSRRHWAAPQSAALGCALLAVSSGEWGLGSGRPNGMQMACE